MISTFSTETTYQYLAGRDRLLARARDRICPLAPIKSRVPRDVTHLDIGCGRGVLLAALATEKGTRSVGCERSATAVAAARRLVAQLVTRSGCPAPTVVHVSTSNDWPMGPFDVVTIVDVLHHVPSESQPEFLAAAACRVRPGGLLLFKDMASRPRWKRMMNTLHDLILARQLVSYMALDQVVALFRLQGLQLAESEQYSALWYAHELAVLHRPI